MEAAFVAIVTQPLRHGDAASICKRAGVPASFATSENILRSRALVERIWPTDLRWSESDAEAPLAFQSYVSRPAVQVVAELPFLGAVVHHAWVRQLIRSSHVRAIRDVLGTTAFAAVVGLHVNTPLTLSEPGTAEIFGDAHAGLEHLGVQALGALAASLGPCWRELVRLRLPIRFDKTISSVSPASREQADAIVREVLPLIPGLLGHEQPLDVSPPRRKPT